MLLSTNFLYETVLLLRVSSDRFIYPTLSPFPQDPIIPYSSRSLPFVMGTRVHSVYIEPPAANFSAAT
jgi:hypothetical protein